MESIHRTISTRTRPVTLALMSNGGTCLNSSSESTTREQSLAMQSVVMQRPRAFFPLIQFQALYSGNESELKIV